jgi:hypothetical protein
VYVDQLSATDRIIILPSWHFLALPPPTEPAPAIGVEPNLPSIAITAAAGTTLIAAPPSQRAKLSQWWEQNRDDIMSSVIMVFEVTSKVLELVPAAQPAAKAFEYAASMLENVQVAGLRTSADDPY